jgi:hypothetical protein
VELRAIIARIEIQPARGLSLLATEAKLRNTIAALSYVREIEVTSSRPVPETSKPRELHRSDIDNLAESWLNGNHAHVIEVLGSLPGVLAALAGAYLYHEMPDEYNRGVFARMLQAAHDKGRS